MVAIRAALFWISCFTAWLLCVSAAGAEPATRPPATLHLVNGDSIVGELKDAEQSQLLRWHSPDFATPFDLPLPGVSAVHFPVPDQRPKPAGQFCFELVGGDLLFGSLIALSPLQAKLDLPGFGRVHVDRENIRRLLRWRDRPDLIYLGPNGLEGWSHSAQWQDDSGFLATSEKGAFLHGDLNIPARASIELELSWTKRPKFSLAVAVDDSQKSLDQAFRFEVWADSLVALRETDDDADLALLQTIGPGAGRLHLQAYLDQDQNRLVVLAADGKKIADLKVTGGESQTFSGLRLTNLRGNVRLERLCITRWNSDPPRELQAGKARIHRADGSIVYGEVKAFDQADQEFVVAEDAGETRIKAKDVGSIVLSPTTEAQQRAVRVALQNGVRISGELVKVERGQLWLKAPGVAEPLPLPVAELRTILSLDTVRPTPLVKGRMGRLELDGVRLHGKLVEGREAGDASCLVWHPRGSTTASALRRGAAGRIVYKEPRRPRMKKAAVREQRNLGFFGAIGLALSGSQPSQATIRRASSRPSLHLRTGDMIPCDVKRIDETGVTFESPLSNVKFVPHEKVKAVELAGAANRVRLTRSKLERLLTLPRIQRDNPPTHLIWSTTGDFLRARLNGLDDTTVTLEVRLETKKVRRDHVARIIWLHEDGAKSDEKAAATPQASTTMRVQAVRSNGIRLTFHPEQLAAATLSGASDVLGACQVEVKDVDQLLIGDAIQHAAARLEFGRWRLRKAIDPEFVTAGEGQGGRPSGTESALVGQAAPDFELELLDGKKFRLSQQQGKVVVLDFWATWCGPCVQAMPLIDRVMHEFEDHDVRLIAVNLQEDPERIKSLLKRLKLSPTVALDIDGAVADKYEAIGIPQTVIVDSAGKIIRVFVGGGPQFEEQLRDAMNSILEGDVADPDAP